MYDFKIYNAIKRIVKSETCVITVPPDYTNYIHCQPVEKFAYGSLFTLLISF